mgnify:CR=1 FL=1|tara:strand:- start:342 stop:500 length:159 start_codon:yes stop_codon:yes gene_type:complete
MKDYQVRYKDEDGCLHDCEITAADIPKAIDNCFELHSDCKQVIRAYLKPMFN